MEQINKPFEQINKNLLYQASVTDFRPTSTDSEELNEKLRDKFVNIYKESLNTVESEIDMFHKEIDFFGKVKELQNLIQNEPEDDHAEWRFFTDIDTTMNSLLCESRKEFLAKLTDLDKQYDSLCKSLEDKIKQKFSRYEKVKENLNDKCFELSEALKSFN